MWELQIILETNDGYLVSAPNGDTQWLTKDEYLLYVENRRKLEQRNS
jgi:transcriptional antiterminator Rof (Rho-off)